MRDYNAKKYASLYNEKENKGDIMLKIEHVSKTFLLSKKQCRIEKLNSREKIAVNDLSFVANEGEIYGLLGPNGAGKTTTLRIIATLISPDQGDVKLDDISIKKEPYEFRRSIAFLTSDLKLEEFFTPNYLFDYYSELHHIDPETKNKRKEALFKRFGIDKFAEVKVGELSTGMKQKASIAISLVHDPRVIVFDEPTNGLDVITAKTVTDFLLELKGLGKTIIVSTHIFSLIEKISDRVGIIIDGKMVKEGTLEELTKEKNLEDTFFDIYQEIKGE